MEGIKYLTCVIWADYRPHNENCPHYTFEMAEILTHKQIKEWFESVYSWLDVKRIEWKGEVKEYRKI